MTGVYLFAAAAGVPLLVWSLLGGADDTGHDGGDDGFGALMFRLLPLSTVAIALAAFGVTGLVTGVTDSSATVTLVAAIAVAVLAGALNSFAFAYLRRSESSISIDDSELAGARGHVVMPIAATSRGRIAVTTRGQQVYLSALAVPGSGDDVLEAGAPVLVVEVRGGIATVVRLDPELA
ncbi:MAG TPA: hypothetical protein VNB24_06985 [Acidimicrobiales bacterium]|nr:hypothetical protein [Acidimicrobiales bacterium]